MQEFGRMGFSEEQGVLLDVAASFCRKQSPIVKVRSLIEDEQGYDSGVWQEIVELGWTGIAIPEVYGGSGLGLGEVVPVMEEMGRTLMSTPFYSTTLAAQALLMGGTEYQKQDLLPKIMAGSIATLAIIEPHGDWNMENLTVTARDTGVGRIAISGEKILVQDAAFAKWVIISARYNDTPSLIVVDASEIPEGAIRREVTIDETKRAYAICLDGIEVDASALMNQVRISETFAHIHLAANLLTAAEMCGGACSTINYIIDYLKTRKQFGRFIGSYQALKHPVVSAYIGYEQARSHLYSAAHCFEEKGVGEIATRMARVQSETVFSFAADRAIQFHGGFGFTYDCDAQLYLRRAIWLASQFGDAGFHRQKLASLVFNERN